MSEQEFNTPDSNTYDLLMARRSIVAREMSGPSPDDKTIRKILAAGIRVPDHGKLAPWRFLVLLGNEREKFGDIIAEALVAENVSNAKTAEKMKGYATQGPALIIVISAAKEHPAIPVWEQELSAGAVCQNMLIAATALGFASQWLTGWSAYSPTVAKGLGLAEHECIAGLMFFGTQKTQPTDRKRPILEDHITWGIPAHNSAKNNEAND